MDPSVARGMHLCEFYDFGSSCTNPPADDGRYGETVLNLDLTDRGLGTLVVAQPKTLCKYFMELLWAPRSCKHRQRGSQNERNFEMIVEV